MNMVEKIVFEPLADSHREAVIRIFNHYVMNGTAAFSDAELPESSGLCLFAFYSTSQHWPLDEEATNRLSLIHI